MCTHLTIIDTRRRRKKRRRKKLCQFLLILKLDYKRRNNRVQKATIEEIIEYAKFTLCPIDSFTYCFGALSIGA